MKVLKFGGTSVGSVESLLSVKKIVEEITGKAIIVVSALGGLTDQLITTAKLAAQGNAEWQNQMDKISRRHLDIISNVILPDKHTAVKERVMAQLTGLQHNLQGIYLIRQLPDNILDVVVSFGERMSSIIVAKMIENGKRYFSPDFIKTEKWYGKNIINAKLTDSLIKKTFDKMGDNEKAIVPGFISTDTHTSQITNLGRGGSDFTGALIAASLDADILEIWTDVDGFMTADPRVVKEAFVMPHLSFPESMELCTFGAKVIYPPTIYPVFNKNIPIKILNTFNPSAPGTLVSDAMSNSDEEIKGVTALKDVALISVSSAINSSDFDMCNRALNVLSQNGIRIIPVANIHPESEANVAIHAADGDEALQLLQAEFAPEISARKLNPPSITNDLSAIAVVGRDMNKQNRLVHRLCNSLLRADISVEATSDGSSDTTVLFFVASANSSKALLLLHSILFQN